MTSRELFNRFAGGFGYGLEKTSGDRLGGHNLHRDINLILKGKERPVIFDLGANEGQSVRLFLRDFNRPKIVSFEPSAATFVLLKERFGAHPDVRLMHAAAGESDGEAELNVFASSQMNSLLTLRDADLPGGRTEKLSVRQTERVEVISLDTFCAKNDVSEIDILKMDCQGAEPGILRGAARLLREGRIRVLYLEVLFLPLYVSQAGLHDYCEFLKPFGLELTGFYRQAFRHNRLFHADVCFHRKD